MTERTDADDRKPAACREEKGDKMVAPPRHQKQLIDLIREFMECLGFINLSHQRTSLNLLPTLPYFFPTDELHGFIAATSARCIRSLNWIINYYVCNRKKSATDAIGAHFP